ncbi:MAG: hypothetical protein Kow00121_51740 [Elainellaceae cyanobacterium]
MHRPVLFLSRFALSLWIVLVTAFLSLLLTNAPSVPTTPFASVSIASDSSSAVYLPNRIFTCTETDQQFQCQAEIQDRLLDLHFTKGIDYKYDFSSCRASYDGRSVGCQKTGLTHAPILAGIYEITNLELSLQQLQAVQQQHWGINTIMELGELRLLWISTGLSLLAGISVAFFAWFHPGLLSKGFASIACGFGMYQLVWNSLARWQYDLVTPYGFTPDTWGVFVNGAAIAAGIGTILATALILWRGLNRLSKILISISSSAGFFQLCWQSFSWNFIYMPSFFGFNETFPEYGSLLMWLSTAISILLAIAAAILLWRHTYQSIRRFLCLGNGFGAIAFATQLLLALLLGLGYAD